MLQTLPRRSDRRRRSRSRGLIVLLAFVLILVLIALAGGLYWQHAIGASGPQHKVEVTIPGGASGSQVGDLLKSKGVIRSTFAFRLLARFRGFKSGFRAGNYTNLTTNMTVEDALAALKDGPEPPPPTVKVTFPEGYRIADTANRAHKVLGIPTKPFIKAANSGSYSLPPYLPKGTTSVEGFLFPNTYEFFETATGGDVIKRLLAEFKTEATHLNWGATKTLHVTDYQVVVVASLIEREAKFQEDRPKIAAVIYNRIRAGMPLQVDATIQYAKGHWGPITDADKQIDSLYNTYLHTGLPPTPIASPGLASLKAALAPANAAYLYYVVTDCKGHHRFATTFVQFQQLLATRPASC